ncbi:MAG: prolipoprotein diacylglyceryl transferase family protein [Faecousia sp.]
MDRIAFMIGGTFIYWNSIVLTLAAGVAICVFLACYLPRGNGNAAAVAVPMALVLSVVLARLVHWYFRPDSYTGFLAAMTDYTSGGYALLGVFLACGLTALVLRLLRLEMQPTRLLDAMSLGGCAGIALGRLACFFSTADRGQILQSIRSLPFAYPVNNVVTGAPEYRLATFVIQSMVTALIFGVLLLFFLLNRRRGAGDVTLLFALLYGMSQAVLDSTRYDSLFMRSNGFISVVQLSGAAAVVGASAWFSVRMVKVRGFRGWYPAIWIVMLALLGGAGYMEYFVQRHGDRALFSYSIMTACLGVIAALALFTYFRTRQAEE